METGQSHQLRDQHSEQQTNKGKRSHLSKCSPAAWLVVIFGLALVLAPSVATPQSFLFGVDGGGNDNSSTLLTIDPGSGTPQVIGEAGNGFTGLDIAFLPDGRLFAVSSSRLFELNPQTGAVLSNIGALSGITTAAALAADANGQLFTASFTNGQFRSINQTTGQTTLIGSFGGTPSLRSSGDLAFAPDGTLFGTATDAPTSPVNDLLVRVNVANGQATIVGDIGFADVFGLTFGPDGVLYGAANGGMTPSRLITINTATGAGTAVGDIAASSGISGLAATVDLNQFGNWEPVPGGGLTDAGPEAVIFNNDLLAFVRGTDGHVYQNRLTSGTWTGWSEVPGGGLTASGPEGVVFNEALHLFVRGTDDRVYVNSLSGTTWTGWSEVPGGGLTLAEPGAAVFTEALHLFIRAPDDRVHVNSLSGTTWTGWSEVPGGGLTDAGPTASVFQSTLYVAVRGTDGHLYDNLRGVAGAWTGWREVPGGGQTPSGPGSAVFNGQLWYFVQGTDNHIYENRLAAGASGVWTGWSEVAGGGLTGSGPEAAASTALFLVVRGTDDGIYVNQAP